MTKVMSSSWNAIWQNSLWTSTSYFGGFPKDVFILYELQGLSERMSKVKCLWKSQFTQCYGLCSIQSRAICGVLGTSSGENGEVVDARLSQSILWAGHSGNWGCCKFSSQGCNYLKGFNYPTSVCPPPPMYICFSAVEISWNLSESRSGLIRGWMVWLERGHRGLSSSSVYWPSSDKFLLRDGSC